MHELTARAPSRIQGRAALVQSLTGLLLRVVRFGQHRAQTDAEKDWAASVATAIAEALAVATGPRNAKL